jgi:thiosulfate/3-mercaptopyruvate sulfurtransferase
VSTAWLAGHRSDPDIVLLHVSPNRRVYARRHVPGAVFVPLHRDLARSGTAPDTGDAPRDWLVPGREDVEAALVRWGARRGPGNAVPRLVFYDDIGLNRQAIRGYWLLRLYRYRADRVHVLDGGLRAWVAAGGAVTRDAPPPAPEPAAGEGIALGERDDSLIATADEVLAWSAEASAAGGPTRLLDVRSPEEYVGADGHGALRAGRIPGARHRWFGDLVRDDGTLRPVEDALALVRGSGAEPEDVRATYCMGGIRAALGWFVLHELGGYAEVRNYAGSWEEWGNRADLPIAPDR